MPAPAELRTLVQRFRENVMNRITILPGLILVVVLALDTVGVHVFAVSPQAAPAAREGDEALPTTVQEARTRARILHETMHGVLQVMHRDFFDPNQRLSIPSRSLEDVFKELGRSWSVDVHWLVVNAEAMNVDNKPRDDFEREAARQLAAGKAEHESLEGNLYRFAGSIRLSSQCQKCHVPRRTSTEDRFAGLVISMRLAAGGSP